MKVYQIFAAIVVAVSLSACAGLDLTRFDGLRDTFVQAGVYAVDQKVDAGEYTPKQEARILKIVTGDITARTLENGVLSAPDAELKALIDLRNKLEQRAKDREAAQ